MIKVDNKVKNIYYMLCYSFNKDLLTEKDIANVDSESFDNIYNLFSIILCMMVRKQIKKGMNREYITVDENLSTVKGKINIAETIKSNLHINYKKESKYLFAIMKNNNFFNNIFIIHNKFLRRKNESRTAKSHKNLPQQKQKVWRRSSSGKQLYLYHSRRSARRSSRSLRLW